MKEQRIKKAIENANLAIKMLSDISDNRVISAKRHLNIAIENLQNNLHKKSNNPTIQEQWWDNIIAKVGTGNFSHQAGMRTLKELDDMISAEQKKINDLENKTKDDTLLQD